MFSKVSFLLIQPTDPFLDQITFGVNALSMAKMELLIKSKGDLFLKYFTHTLSIGKQQRARK